MLRPDDRTFPVAGVDSFEGIDLRVYLAGLAMQGLLAGAAPGLFYVGDSNTDAPPERFAEVAVQMADALIVRLNKEA